MNVQNVILLIAAMLMSVSVGCGDDNSDRDDNNILAEFAPEAQPEVGPETTISGTSITGT